MKRLLVILLALGVVACSLPTSSAYDADNLSVRKQAASLLDELLERHTAAHTNTEVEAEAITAQEEEMMHSEEHEHEHENEEEPSLLETLASAATSSTSSSELQEDDLFPMAKSGFGYLTPMRSGSAALKRLKPKKKLSMLERFALLGKHRNHISKKRSKYNYNKKSKKAKRKINEVIKFTPARVSAGGVSRLRRRSTALRTARATTARRAAIHKNWAHGRAIPLPRTPAGEFSYEQAQLFPSPPTAPMDTSTSTTTAAATAEERNFITMHEKEETTNQVQAQVQADADADVEAATETPTDKTIKSQAKAQSQAKFTPLTALNAINNAHGKLKTDDEKKQKQQKQAEADSLKIQVSPVLQCIVSQCTTLYLQCQSTLGCGQVFACLQSNKPLSDCSKLYTSLSPLDQTIYKELAQCEQEKQCNTLISKEKAVQKANTKTVKKQADAKEQSNKPAPLQARPASTITKAEENKKKKSDDDKKKKSTSKKTDDKKPKFRQQAKAEAEAETTVESTAEVKMSKAAPLPTETAHAPAIAPHMLKRMSSSSSSSSPAPGVPAVAAPLPAAHETPSMHSFRQTATASVPVNSPPAQVHATATASAPAPVVAQARFAQQKSTTTATATATAPVNPLPVMERLSADDEFIIPLE